MDACKINDIKKQATLSMTDKKDYSLLAHNTFGIDAKCSRFVELSTVEEAAQFLPSLKDSIYMLIGGGSNLLLTQDYDGIVVHSNIRGIETTEEEDNILVRCGSGENWDDIVSYCVEHEYYGTENLSLIPGDAGASAVQNIGAYGVEIKDIIEKVEAIEIESGKTVEFSNNDCKYSYRRSIFKGEWKNKYFITHVTYRLSRIFNPNLDYGNIRTALAEKGINNPTAKELRQTIIEIRKSKLPDPIEQGNAGSFFMNPIVGQNKFNALLNEYPSMPYYIIDEKNIKIPAGWLIDQCGWKGKSLGKAGVHDKQALVLVNRGGATGEDIVRLYKTIKKDVNKKFGIQINPEVNVI